MKFRTTVLSILPPSPTPLYPPLARGEATTHRPTRVWHYDTWRHKGAFIVVAVCSFTACAAPAVAQSLVGDPNAEFESALQEFDQAQQIQAQNRARAAGLFRSAARRLEALVESGIVNGKLEYNLGNCYLQAGDVGLAILHYRRAERLIPGDPLLVNNLKEARSRCVTAIAPHGRSMLLRGLFYPHYALALSTRARIGMVAFALCWVMLAVRNFLRRRWLSGLALACLLVAASFGASVGVSLWSDRNEPAGVLLTMDVVAYKGPGAGYQRQFEQPLQPGTEFTLRGRRGGWWNIELPDGKSGWVEAAQGALIPR